MKLNKDLISGYTDSSSWIKPLSNYEIYYRKTLDDIEINVSLRNVTLPAYGQLASFTLPEGYRPSKNVRVPVHTAQGLGGGKQYLEVQTGGSAYIFNWGSSVTVETLDCYVLFKNN